MVPTSALNELALFAGLSEAGKAELQSTSTLREFRAGETILIPGELGRFLYAIDTGTVSVQPTSAKRELAIILGPGEIFGEMSLLSGTPISAAVIAVRDCRLYEISARTFDKLFADEPAFRRGIADLLAQRLRLRTSDKQQAPICAFIALPPFASAVSKALARGVDHYAQVVELGCFQSGSGKTQVLGRQIDSWRASAHVGEICVVSVLAQSLGGLQDYTRPGDAVLLIDDGAELPALTLSAGWGLTDVAMVRVGAAARQAGQADQTWSYRLEDAEIAAALSAPEWNPRATPVLDSIARWMARRTVGVALGSGAARGFAHVGVLDVLDAAGVPIDFLSGSSMGGIVALYYAITGSADGAGALVRSTLGSKKLIWDVSILPRLALFRGRKGRRSAERVAGGKYFPDLTRPAIAVAADLIKGERVVLDRGLVTTAAVATATIPGLFPPVRCGEQWLVDGAVVSRVPVDLLDRWRCGLKIAVNVELSANAEDAQARATLQRALHGLFGLRSIIARSWELLGVSHGAAETQAADIVINAGTQQHSGYDFDAIDSFISAGRAAAERKLPEILDAVKSLIRPRPR
jgi:predicted acylesterase/phospholipase RssA/CRP-like cAMP-binding protein